MVSKDFKATRFYLFQYKLNANMADHSVGARDELHESEASEASMFCFDNASPQKLKSLFKIFRLTSAPEQKLTTYVSFCSGAEATRREILN